MVPDEDTEAVALQCVAAASLWQGGGQSSDTASDLFKLLDVRHAVVDAYGPASEEAREARAALDAARQSEREGHAYWTHSEEEPTRTGLVAVLNGHEGEFENVE